LRLVFETYTKEAPLRDPDWITSHGFFVDGGVGHRG
jgi:hypothetical protein